MSAPRTRQNNVNNSVVSGLLFMAGAQKIRLVICGDGAVGKSCLSIQWVSSVFVTDYDPTIENIYRKQVLIEGRTTMVDLLDTAGQEEFGAMRDHYLRSGEGFLIIYSITERNTYNVACELYEAIKRLKELDHVPVVLVGNKSDLEEKRCVSTMEAAAIARTWGIPFFETSAKTRYNIETAFNAAVIETRKFLEEGGMPTDPSAAKKDKEKKAKCIIL